MVKVADLLRTPDTARQVCTDAYNGMDEAERAFLDNVAEDIFHLWKLSHDDANNYYHAQLLDNDERLALWSLLPSYIRTYLKAHKPV